MAYEAGECAKLGYEATEPQDVFQLYAEHLAMVSKCLVSSSAADLLEASLLERPRGAWIVCVIK